MSTENNSSNSLFKVGCNIYRGQVSSNNQTCGYGTIFDEKHEQFIIGTFRNNRLLKLHIGQFVLKNSQGFCSIKKFKDNQYLFEYEKEDLILKLCTTNLTNLNIGEPFHELLDKLWAQSKVIKILEDPVNESLLEFCHNFKTFCLGIDWKKEDSSKVYEFFQLNRDISLNCNEKVDIQTLLKKFKDSRVLSGAIMTKLLGISNNIIRRNGILKFSDDMLHQSFQESMRQIFIELSERYRNYLIELSDLRLHSDIMVLEKSKILLVRLADCATLIEAENISIEFGLPFRISKVFKRISMKSESQINVVPIIVKSYPIILRALSKTLKEFSVESNITYEELLNTLFIKKNQIMQPKVKSLKYSILINQLYFIRDLLVYYKPGESLKMNLYSGPREDYSVWSSALLAKTTSFLQYSSKATMIEDARIWMDLLDLNLSVIFQNLVENQPGISDYFKKYANLIVNFFKQLNQFNDKEGYLLFLYEMGESLTEVAILVSSNTVELLTDEKKSQIIEAFFDKTFSSLDDTKDFISLLTKKIDDELRKNKDVIEDDIVISLKPM